MSLDVELSKLHQLIKDNYSKYMEIILKDNAVIDSNITSEEISLALALAAIKDLGQQYDTVLRTAKREGILEGEKLK